MRGNAILDDVEREAVFQAFADPVSKGELVTNGGFSPLAEGITQIQDGIITARKVEVARDEAKVLQKIAARAAAVGTDWFYRFPVKSKDGTKWITGPSIKCANNVARLYGNCQVDTRVVDSGQTWIIYARFVDYETGFSYTRPFQQAKNASRLGGSGPEADARRLDIALQIGASKAIRNVVCNALEPFADFAFDEAQKNLVEKVGKKLDEYRTRVLQRLAEYKVDVKRVEQVKGRTADKWLAPDVAQIIAEMQAIADGMATIDETWPPLEPGRTENTGAAHTSSEQATSQPGPDQAEQQRGEPSPPGDKATSGTVGSAASQQGAEVGGGDRKPEAATGQPDQATAKKSWAIAEDIVGQDAKLKALMALLMKAETEADCDAIAKDNQEFIDKLGRKKSETLHTIETRKQVLAKANAE